MTSKLTITREQATDKEIQMLIDSHENGTAMFLRVDAYYLMAKELQERRKAGQDSEPVAVVEPSDYVTAAQLVGEGPARKAVHELYEGALRIGDKLYRHAQPAPAAYSDFEEFWAAYIHPLAQDDELKGFAWDIWNAAMLQAGNSPVIPDGYVMVPKEPTDDMCFAPDVRVGNKTWDGYQSSADMAECKAIYEAMLAAAPQEVQGE